MAKLIDTYRYNFRGAGAPPSTADSGAFVSSSTGSGASIAVDSGAVKLAFDNTSQAAQAAIHFGDHLAFDIDDLVRVEFLAKFDSAIASNVIVSFGVASAYNSTIDNIAEQASFRMEGSNTLLCESDDGTNNNDDIAAGLSGQSDWQRFAIDFATGIATKGGRQASVGGKGDVLFHAGNASGRLRRVAQNTAFDMSNYSGGLQPFVHIEKASSTDTGNLWVRDICVTCKST